MKGWESIVDMSAAATTSAYSYQNALKTGGSPAAVLQALSQTYASQNATPPGPPSAPDNLTQLAGSSTAGSSVSGVQPVSTVNRNNVSPVQGVQPSLAALGEQSASPVSSLLQGDASGSSPTNIAAAEAMATYQYQQVTNSSPGNTSNAAAAYAQQLSLTAQAMAPVNLLA
jgi:hypothetical protein